MNLSPTQNFLKCRLISQREGDSRIVIPEKAAPIDPHGLVLETGPDCKFVKPGDRVLFLPANMVAGYNESTEDECFIMPEGAVFAFYKGEE